MKLFFYKLNVVLGWLLLINFIIAGLVLSSSELYWDTNKLEGKSVVAMGDSHAIYAFLESNNSPTAEFCWMSDTYLDVKTRIAYLEKTGVLNKIKTVVLQADPYAFTGYRHFDTPVEDLRLSPASFYKVCLPLFFNHFILSDLKTSILNRSNLRFCAQKKVAFPLHPDSAQILQRFNNQYLNYYTATGALENFKFIVEYLQSKNVGIIGIKYPVSAYYYYTSMHSDEYKKSDQTSDSIFRQYKIPVMDFRDKITDPEMFRDADHLNTKGSAEFIKLFNIALKK